ncbi:MAG TPA: ImmA/IrrE family metallo-endopeptidase, partial [Nitrospira sp.]|nr:ImmA/IrrE family metallo-endopeptidase [Nitrospira sp.]
MRIECKNYTKAVPVDDAEEFFAKVQQVAPAKAKAVLASKAPFQLSTRKFAQAKGIGLLRYFSQDNCKWELRRSPSGSVRTGVAVDVSEIVSGLTNPDHISEVFDLYLQSPTRDTNSLNDFLRDLLLDDAFSPSQLREITNTRTKRSSIIPFIEKGELENIATGVLQDISYTCGKVPLQQMCEYEAIRSGLIVNHNVKPRPEFINRQVLGRITFDPPKIEIYHQANRSPGRLRFTLAHELAHHLLGHGKFLRREYCQDRDFSIE